VALLWRLVTQAPPLDIDKRWQTAPAEDCRAWSMINLQNLPALDQNSRRANGSVKSIPIE
jgi:hypothetical protein